MLIETVPLHWSYIALIAGTFLEGETILVIAGFAAQGGYLYLPFVVLSGFIGSYLGDLAYFFIGRYKGIDFLRKRPRLKAKIDRAERLIEKYQKAVALGFRFVYGLRQLTPFILGTSKMKTSHFMIFNLVSAIAWAVLIGGGGYLFGTTLERFLGDMRRYELEIIMFILVAGIAFWSVKTFVVREKKYFEGKD